MKCLVKDHTIPWNAQRKKASTSPAGLHLTPRLSQLHMIGTCITALSALYPRSSHHASSLYRDGEKVKNSNVPSRGCQDWMKVVALTRFDIPIPLFVFWTWIPNVVDFTSAWSWYIDASLCAVFVIFCLAKNSWEGVRCTRHNETSTAIIRTREGKFLWNYSEGNGIVRIQVMLARSFLQRRNASNDASSDSKITAKQVCIVQQLRNNSSIFSIHHVYHESTRIFPPLLVGCLQTKDMNSSGRCMYSKRYLRVLLGS